MLVIKQLMVLIDYDSISFPTMDVTENNKGLVLQNILFCVST